MAVTTNGPRRQRPQKKIAPELFRQLQDSLSAWNTMHDILQVLGQQRIEVAKAPNGQDTTAVAHIGPVAVTVLPADSRVHLKADGLTERILQTMLDSGHLPLSQLEQLVFYLRYAGVPVPDLRVETLPAIARLQLMEGCEEPGRSLELDQRPVLSVVSDPQEQPSAPATSRPTNQRPVRAHVVPANQGAFVTT